MTAIADSKFFSSLEAETRFYIIRHGRTEGNAAGRFQGLQDVPLDDIGRSQARALGAWLSGEGIQVLLSSRLSRSAETAKIAGAACALEPEIDERLVEIDTGVFSGLTFVEARALYPEVFASFEGKSWEAVPGAERADALYDRAMGVWTELRRRALSGASNIACVSHGGFIQWLVRSTFGCRTWMPLLTTANCGVFELVAAPRAGGLAYLQWKLVNFQAPAIPPGA